MGWVGEHGECVHAGINPVGLSHTSASRAVASSHSMAGPVLALTNNGGKIISDYLFG